VVCVAFYGRVSTEDSARSVDYASMSRSRSTITP
jgi:hypothetical protein